MVARKKILITGVTSLLGKYLYRVLSIDYTLVGTYHSTPLGNKRNLPPIDMLPLEITKRALVAQVINRVTPDIVVHLASLSNIDFCEYHPQEAYRVNVLGTQNLLTALKDHPTHLIFLSSNAVFRGDSPPYREEDRQAPLNAYGKSKLAATKLALTSKFPAAIVCATSMFGWPPLGARDNDVTYYLRQLMQPHPIYLVNDRFFNPVYALRAAQAIKAIIDGRFTGIFHVAGKSRVSRYSFVQTLLRAFKLKTRSQLIPVASSFFPKIAPRPVDATLSTDKTRRVLHITPQPLIKELGILSQERDATNIP